VTGVFIDSHAFIAILNPSDTTRSRAVQAIASLGPRVVTTHWVLMEVADALSIPRYREEVAAFLRDLESDPGTEIIPPSHDWYRRGLALYAARPDKGWSLTDRVSFVVMTERGLTDALTGDHHFEQAGFLALLRGE
jgi:predicted nucleic acid-binding protein